jgi:hypothetical protein
MRRTSIRPPEPVREKPKTTSPKQSLIEYMRANAGTRFTSKRGIVGIFQKDGLWEPKTNTKVPYEGTDERRMPRNDYKPNGEEWLVQSEIEEIMRDNGTHLEHPDRTEITKQEFYKRTGRKMPQVKEIIKSVPEPKKKPGPDFIEEISVPDRRPKEVYEDAPF